MRSPFLFCNGSVGDNLWITLAFKKIPFKIKDEGRGRRRYTSSFLFTKRARPVKLKRCAHSRLAPLSNMYETDYSYTSSSSQQIASSSTHLASTSIATSSDIVILTQFSAGEVLIAFLLFIQVLLQLLTMTLRALDRVKTKKSYLGYSGGDVEVRDDI